MYAKRKYFICLWIVSGTVGLACASISPVDGQEKNYELEARLVGLFLPSLEARKQSVSLINIT
jgi:hypothetical protein